MRLGPVRKSHWKACTLVVASQKPQQWPAGERLAVDMVRHKQGIQRLKQKFENIDTVQKVRTAELADLRPVDEAMCLEAGSFSTWEMKQMVILPHIGTLCPPGSRRLCL